MNIGIIGAGIVGSAIEHCFSRVFDIHVHDPLRGTDLNDVLQCVDCVYIAVPTPTDEQTGRCDTSIVEHILHALPSDMVAVIKSTVVPGTTQKFHDMFPHLRIAYSPEFLLERQSIQDFSNQDLLVVGTHHEDVAQLVFSHHQQAGVMRKDQFFHVSPTEAELIKYAKNTFFALKVIFANQMYDLSQELSADYSVIKEIMTADQSQLIGPSHLEPLMGLRRGYGGKCLPKDTRALRTLASEHGIEYNILEAMELDSAKLRTIFTGKESQVQTHDD